MDRVTRLFLMSSAVLLAFSGMIKVSDGLTKDMGSDTTDPVLGVCSPTLSMLVLLVAFVVLALLLRGHRARLDCPFLACSTSKGLRRLLERLPIFCVGLSNLCLDCLGSDLTQYEIDGRLRWLKRSPFQATLLPQTFHFKAWVKGHRWMLRVIPYDQPVATVHMKSITLGTDGSYMYCLRELNPEYDPAEVTKSQLLQVESRLEHSETQREREYFATLHQQLTSTVEMQRNQSPTSSSLNQALGIVSSRLCPPYPESETVGVVWFAYLSHLYLDGHDTAQLPNLWPATDPLQTGTNAFSQAQHSRSQLPPYLPVEAFFFHDGTRGEPSETGITPIRLNPPWGSGYTNAVFRAESFTNLADVHIPLSFSLTSYLPSSGNELVVHAEAHGLITALRDTCTRTAFVPRLAGTTLVEDRRLPEGAQNRQYHFPAGTWPTNSHSEELLQFQNQILGSIARATRYRQVIATTVLGLAITIGFLLVFRTSRRDS